MPIQALIIDEPWIGHIMASRQTWEMRSRSTSKRGPVALVRKGTGHIVATAWIVDALPPLSYRHPSGVVTWVDLATDASSACGRLSRAGRRRSARPCSVRRATCAGSTFADARACPFLGAKRTGREHPHSFIRR